MADPKDLAYKDYRNGMKYKDIAEKYGVTINTVKSWKTRYSWSRDGVHTKEKSVHTKKKSATKEKPKRKSGNPNPQNQFAKRNQAAVTHGLFAKYLPAETLEIMESLNERSPTDLIWDQIQIQYAAILRAQQIMFVADQADMTREIKKESENATEWEIQFAWDKHATFLNAQSRAMSELRSLIKQFNELANEDDERRLKLEQMQLGIDKTKAEIDKLNGLDDEATANGLDQLADALRKSASAIKGDE
ncbi:MAG: phage terminase small subunit [Bacillota bacterium]|nr:phage terminase small subunit [Bacillota bacterium]